MPRIRERIGYLLRIKWKGRSGSGLPAITSKTRTPPGTSAACSCSRVSSGQETCSRTSTAEIRSYSWLGSDAYYVVGDNRGESIDSRTFGEIDRRLIVGKVVYTLW